MLDKQKSSAHISPLALRKFFIKSVPHIRPSIRAGIIKYNKKFLSRD